jgi:hypothetical protein
MRLTKKEKKSHLEIQQSRKRLVIAARNQDAEALAAYFLQYGVSSDTKPSKSKAEVTLQFPKGIDRSYIESVLNGYKKQFLGLSASS